MSLFSGQSIAREQRGVITTSQITKKKSDEKQMYWQYSIASKGMSEKCVVTTLRENFLLYEKLYTDFTVGFPFAVIALLAHHQTNVTL